MKKFGWLFYTFIFFILLVLFIFVSFPYTVLKEAALVKVAEYTGLDIRVEQLKPRLPLGIGLEGVAIPIDNTSHVKLRDVSVDVALLDIFKGRIGADVLIVDPKGGELELYTSLSIANLIDLKYIPDTFLLEVRGFTINSLANLGIEKAKQALSSQAVLADLVGNFKLTGKLNGSGDVFLPIDNPQISKGKLTLKLQGAELLIDPALKIEDQKFSKASVQAELVKGVVKIDPRSGFHTDELLIDLAGKIQLKKKLNRSSLDVDLALQLEKSLKSQYGFLIDNSFKGSGGGMKGKIKGSILNPRFTAL